MRTKKKFIKLMALLTASIVVVTTMPIGMMELQAEELVEIGEMIYDFPPELCPGYTENSDFPGRCMYCGNTKAQHSRAKEAEEDEKRSRSSGPDVPSKTAEEIAREKSIAEGEAQQEAIRKESEVNMAVMASDGREMKSTLSGAYTAKSVKGTAVTTPQAQAEKELGLKEGAKLNVTTWDVNTKNSPLAAQSLEAAANAAGGDLGPMFQVNVNQIMNGKVQKMDPMQGSLEMKVGVPDGFNTDGTQLAVAHVVEGGAFEIQNDLDDDPNTVTFQANTGDGAYALVKKKANGSDIAAFKAQGWTGVIHDKTQ